jgi:hypothetical protein
VAKEVVIERRFRGPPASANGGYTCGILASALGRTCAQVNLRKPPPLDRPLTVELDDGGVRLVDGAELIADGRPLEDLEVELPTPPRLHDAEDADRRYPYYDDHAFPACFVCGPDREPGDGLCIYPGPIEGRTIMACAWTPESDLADADGGVAPEIVWAALDCPSGNAAHHFARDERPMVLARLRAKLARAVAVGRPHIVVGWPIGRDGRKHSSGTALFDAAGEPVAFAEALWIELRG